MILDRREIHVLNELKRRAKLSSKHIRKIRGDFTDKTASAVYGHFGRSTRCTITTTKEFYFGSSDAGPRELTVVPAIGRMIAFTRAVLDWYNDLNYTQDLISLSGSEIEGIARGTNPVAADSSLGDEQP